MKDSLSKKKEAASKGSHPDFVKGLTSSYTLMSELDSFLRQDDFLFYFCF